MFAFEQGFPPDNRYQVQSSPHLTEGQVREAGTILLSLSDNLYLYCSLTAVGFLHRQVVRIHTMDIAVPFTVWNRVAWCFNFGNALGIVFLGHTYVGRLMSAVSCLVSAVCLTFLKVCK